MRSNHHPWAPSPDQVMAYKALIDEPYWTDRERANAMDYLHYATHTTIDLQIEWLERQLARRRPPDPQPRSDERPPTDGLDRLWDELARQCGVTDEGTLGYRLTYQDLADAWAASEAHHAADAARWREALREIAVGRIAADAAAGGHADSVTAARLCGIARRELAGTPTEPAVAVERAYRFGWQDGRDSHAQPYDGDWWERAKSKVLRALAGSPTEPGRP